jgi:phosphopantothenoylcysteine decarboxylase/phosphopantothenate--cysteine ligase
MRVLITAGPTWEFIDKVRYIGSPSTGRMGFAVAEVFSAAGHTVNLVLGPTQLQPPAGVHVIRVTSAIEMHQAVMELLDSADVVVMTAAVSDYRPAAKFDGKKKRTGVKWLLELVENPDILKEIGAKKGDRILVGFAVESEDPRRGALDKLHRKNLDFIVLNGPAAFASDVVSVEIIDRGERVTPMPNVTKHDVARRLLEVVEALDGERRRASGEGKR